MKITNKLKIYHFMGHGSKLNCHGIGQYTDLLKKAIDAEHFEIAGYSNKTNIIKHTNKEQNKSLEYTSFTRQKKEYFLKSQKKYQKLNLLKDRIYDVIDYKIWTYQIEKELNLTNKIIFVHSLRNLAMLGTKILKNNYIVFIFHFYNKSFINWTKHYFYKLSNITGKFKHINAFIAIGENHFQEIKHYMHNVLHLQDVYVCCINSPVLYNRKDLTYLKDKTELVVYIGWLIIEKNISLMFPLAKQFPDYNFLIIGDGPLYKKYLQEGGKYANLDVQKSMDHAAVLKILEKAKVQILISNHDEGKPMIINEAIANYTLTLTNNHNNYDKKAIKYYNWGTIVKEDDNFETIKMKLHQAMTNYEKILITRLQTENQILASKKNLPYSWEQFSEKWNQIINLAKF